ncbi:MAG: hypothetical protein IPJ77_08825 [Planctomycetes bacterium]|nr:hypothetical protein [Planctomycetota bacterium]
MRTPLTFRGALGLCALLVLAVHPLRAQAPLGGENTPVSVAPTAPELTVPEVDSLLRGRNRGTLHPGNPLELSPRAARGADGPAPALVGADASYQRALAMYDQRARFHEPLPRADGAAEQAAPVQGRGRRAVTEAMPAAPNREWIAFAGIVAVVLGAGWYLRREPRARPPRPQGG